MDRIELDRLVEHVPRRWPPARRNRWRFARLADKGENALDWADNRVSAFLGTAAVEILEADVGSGSTAAVHSKRKNPAGAGC